MQKRWGALTMAIVMLLCTVFMLVSDMSPVYADGELTLKLHYHREDGNYDGWDAWLWEDGHDGNGYAFAEEDGEMVATMELTPGTTKVGFIVRTQDWEKDVDEDQFIDLSELVSGVAHVYVESGVAGYKMEYGENAQTGVKLKSAVYNEDGTLTVIMTGAIEGDEKTAFTVSGKESPVEVTDVTVGSNNEYTLTLAQKLDETKSYVITYDGQENAVTMPIIYSTSEFEDANTYTGDDLGAVWTKDSTAFKVWAPTAEAVSLNLYESGNEEASDLIEQLPMEAGENGIWTVTKEGDLNGTYYTYTVKVDGEETEACDPYARTTGVNEKRAMVIDLDSTDPKDWDKDKNPHAGEGINDAIIYEAHVRDLTVDADAGIKNAGKFLGLTETGTKTKSGVATGVDHIKDLGVTHLHLLPIYDFGSVDESTEGGYNWGYDPVNYNVPEGSYSTDAEHGEVRVSELKQMVSSLHENGISVVMDVVYNHVYNAEEFCFNKIVPGYFSRISEDGTYSNGSGCGNDTASERTMVKKYIVDSVCYWADEAYADVYEYYKGLIAFRKAHGVLRLSSAEDVKAAITPQDNPAENVVAFDITGGVNGETAEEMYVVFNANSEVVDVTIPDGDWNVYINGEKAGTKVLDKVSGGKASVEPISALVLVRKSGLSAGIVAGIVIASIVALALVAAGFIFAGKKKKLNKK